MKRYKLLKDLPGYEAGETLTEIRLHIQDEGNSAGGISTNPAHFPEWFEEVKPQEEGCSECKKPGRFKDSLCSNCLLNDADRYCPLTRGLTKDSSCSSEDREHNHTLLPRQRPKPKKPSEWIRVQSEGREPLDYIAAILDFLDEHYQKLK